MIQPFKAGWYVLYVKSCQERKAYLRLQESGHETFLPLVKTVRQWSDRKKAVFKPLFPSYVFAYFRSQMDFHRAFSVEGICTCVRFGKEYARVTDTEIDKIRFLTGTGDVFDIETNVSLPSIGEMRRIVYGSLRGIECEVIKIKNVNKIVVRIDSLRQNIVATLPSYYFSDAFTEVC